MQTNTCKICQYKFDNLKLDIRYEKRIHILKMAMFQVNSYTHKYSKIERHLRNVYTLKMISLSLSEYFWFKSKA